MSWKGFVMQSIANGAAIVRRDERVRSGLRILMYHSVGSLVFGDKLGLHTISEKRFREHLDSLAGMVTVPLQPLLIPKSDMHIAVTFDDGYADNLNTAAPLLVERSIPFTVFVTSSFIRNHEPGFLSPGELKQLAQLPGVIIGSHGCTHCHLNHCSDNQLRAELGESRRYLEDLIGRSVTALAYPYGSSDRRVRDAALSAGYQLATCSRFDINQGSREPLMLNRCVILSEDNEKIFRQKIAGDWDWYRWRSKDPLNIKQVD
ncbi:polysaccharide deacetylase family protein [Chlorobium sp. BLA1]|uniref:polysaccharide deacetylase family protein n=1 Tax=Candidatus Chlorobium masyuteum TaxID=2716876 RepID=UPI00142203F4|nr:polysaccharide deacetylase family protein [Candidatus Chlorobium masyuteum]NHQ59185.1 polysaccharide deacetylase family protein [Candidatus Chlorobium masyuteum]